MNSIATDLLAQALHLIMKEPRRPKQASLRRAISNAYYAAFHLLIQDGSNLLLSAATKKSVALPTIHRAYQHSQMKSVCEELVKTSLPKKYQTVFSATAPPSKNLKILAQYFIDLQKERHIADYDLNTSYIRNEVYQIYFKAELLFSEWETIRHTPEAVVFASLLLLGHPRE